MVQFYFLSVFCNLVTGVVLFFSVSDRMDGIAGTGTRTLSENNTFLLVMGILSAIVGLLKLFIVMKGIRGGIVIFGDLLPSLGGLFGGFTLLLQYYQRKTSDEFSIHNPVLSLILSSGKYTGAALILIAVLHFFFPTALFL
jgi:hypothetical protein